MQHVLIIDIILLVIYAQLKEVLPACEPYLVFVREEELCLNKMQLNITSKAEDCIGMWDHVNCWPDASVGETVSQPCPSFFKSAVKGKPIPLGMFTGNVYRNCTDQGWTDPFSPLEEACDYSFNDTLHFFEESTDTYRYFIYVKTMYTIGYSLSLISLTIAIIILCLFRKLHCTRNYIHIQLFLSFILRAAFIFIRDAQLFTNEDLYHCDYYPVACKAVLMLSNYCILANYSWLLVEGHYLYTLVNFSLFSKSQHLCWYTVLGWGLPMVVISSWGLAKYFYEDEGCWETRGHDWIWWILKVPVLLFIVTNVFFFLSIIRVLVGKLKMSDVHGNEINQCKRLIKSTFFLVALFGLQYVLFVFVPVRISNAMFKIWNFAELTLASTQGFVVAVLYCFLNGEVQFEIQRRWRRWRLRRHLHGESRQYHGSISQSGSACTQVSLLACGPTQVV